MRIDIQINRNHFSIEVADDITREQLQLLLPSALRLERLISSECAKGAAIYPGLLNERIVHPFLLPQESRYASMRCEIDSSNLEERPLKVTMKDSSKYNSAEEKKQIEGMRQSFNNLATKTIMEGEEALYKDDDLTLDLLWAFACQHPTSATATLLQENHLITPNTEKLPSLPEGIRLVVPTHIKLLAALSRADHLTESLTKSDNPIVKFHGATVSSALRAAISDLLSYKINMLNNSRPEVEAEIQAIKDKHGPLIKNAIDAAYKEFKRSVGLRVFLNVVVAIAGIALLPLGFYAAYKSYQHTKETGNYGLFSESAEQEQFRKLKTPLGDIVETPNDRSSQDNNSRKSN